MSNDRPVKCDTDLIERSRRLIAESVATRRKMREMQDEADKAMAARQASLARSTDEQHIAPSLGNVGNPFLRQERRPRLKGASRTATADPVDLPAADAAPIILQHPGC